MNKLFMLIGLIGSGKSTYAQNLKENGNNIQIHSSDSIRKELFGDERLQIDNELVFKTLHQRIKKDLNDGKDVIYDSCNINYKRRMEFLKQIKNIKDIQKIAIVFATSFERCLENNKKRERVVPEEAIIKMYKSFYVPQYFEGWEYIDFKYNYNTNDYTLGKLQEKLNVEQDNPHHKLTVYEHCKKVSNLLSTNVTLKMAGLLHDCGKPFCKSFLNKNNEITEVANYYNHQNVGAYETMFWLANSNNLEITKFVQWHMLFFNEISKKSLEKYTKLFGKQFMQNLKLLHEADIEAKK